MTSEIHEETPILAPDGKKRPTPLPFFQFSIVILLQLAEPLPLQVIYPFAPQFIRDLGITKGKESQVGYYVGLVHSVFFLTQACTILHWSRISDHVGRKPVILTSLSAISLSMYCFGLSRTFWGLMLCRSLNGALDGNIGVIKGMMAEMTDETNIAQAYAYMTIAWSTAAALGPMIGGSLSRPAERFPRLFGNSEFLKEYPYFLPCAVPATLSAVAWVITYLFLEETVRSPTPVAQYIGFQKDNTTSCTRDGIDDADDTSCAQASSSKADNVQTINNKSPEGENPLPLRSVLTRRVIVAAGNYASLSLVDIAFRAIQPLFFSTPIHLGGLGLQPAAIGNLLSIFGILNGLFQLFFFARMNDRWGSKNIFMIGIASAIPIYLSFPIINTLARHQGYSIAVWTAVSLQIVISVALSLSYGAIFIFISAASPNRASLGATNGLSQMSVSFMRGIGPAAASSLFSLCVDKQYLGSYLVYYILLALVGVSLVIGSFLPGHVWMDRPVRIL